MSTTQHTTHRLRAGLYKYRGLTIERNDGWNDTRLQGAWIVTNENTWRPQVWDEDFPTLAEAITAIDEEEAAR